VGREAAAFPRKGGDLVSQHPRKGGLSDKRKGKKQTDAAKKIAQSTRKTTTSMIGKKGEKKIILGKGRPTHAEGKGDRPCPEGKKEDFVRTT